MSHGRVCVRIEPHDDANAFGIDVKRFYAPFTIHSVCPECGQLAAKDLSSDYLSFPSVNEPERVHFYCEYEDDNAEGGYHCCEWSETVIMRLTMEAA